MDNIILQHNEHNYDSATRLQKALNLLDIQTILSQENTKPNNSLYFNLNEIDPLNTASTDALLEKIIEKIPINFENLPLLVEGESKIIKSLNDKIVVELFKPTVYSYTKNRYGTVAGTEELRAKFTAEVFRQMNIEKNKPNGRHLNNAFLASIQTKEGTLNIQRKVVSSNLEVRVKRFHIGSPVHRYKYTDDHPTIAPKFTPLKKWDRFDNPLICFDWRNPLTDDDGNRLADEPISDDYAAIWMHNVPQAKKLALDTFLWLEQLFYDAHLTLIDICFFIDQSGKYVFGEISPDCMRVREGRGHPKDAKSLDKDLWRNGEKEDFLAKRYDHLYNVIFKSIKI